jgi:uncharacterized protein
MVKTEAEHKEVRDGFARLIEEGHPIWTTSLGLAETLALLQHRIGISAARDFDDDIVPLLSVVWVEEDLYRRGVERLWREDRRRLSLVDCLAFEFMKLRGVTTAFAVDPHFREAGFELVPAG